MIGPGAAGSHWSASGAALIDTTYVSNAVDALLAALDHCLDVRGRALVVTNGEPRPVAEILAAVCRAAGVRVPTRHVPVRLAHLGGAAVESLWALPGPFHARRRPG